ncbi:hypothetical protein EX30DRAFT_361166, partial [Ascodesmis nigricans]
MGAACWCCSPGYEYWNDGVCCTCGRTGMKALPAEKVAVVEGLVLHDSHAEVLAIRAFNRYLLSECHPNSTVLSYNPGQQPPYSLHPHILLHLYASEAPCGDASMELIMSRQEDSTPWPEPRDQVHFRGRGYFSHLGIVRTKPGRADSPETLSKSCTDKLSMRCGLSLLLTPTALLVSPEGVYISSMVIPESEYSETAVTRAFGKNGRMVGVAGADWGGGYRWHEMRIVTTKREFEFSRRRAGPKGCNVSAVVVKGVGEETVVGGVIGGRKPGAGWKAGSMICRAKLWAVVKELSPVINVPAKSARKISYSEVKALPELEARRK